MVLLTNHCFQEPLLLTVNGIFFCFIIILLGFSQILSFQPFLNLAKGSDSFDPNLNLSKKKRHFFLSKVLFSLFRFNFFWSDETIFRALKEAGFIDIKFVPHLLTSIKLI